MVAEFLGLQGHVASFALDGRSALESALELVPDVALLDITLPDMTGYELARRLRLEPTLAKVVLVALTGWAGPDHEAQAREAGFDHHLVKPLEFAKLQLILDS